MKISEEILSVISLGIIESNIFKITNGQLDRKTYLAVNEVLENIGGKWDRKNKGHKFEEDPTEKIENILLTGESVNEKKLYQFFETPKHLAKRMIDIAEITDDMDILEPSAGLGSIADEIKNTGGFVRCCELDPKKAQKLIDKDYLVAIGDFLSQDWEQFDRIIMNPPFTKQQDIDHIIKAFEILKPNGRLVAIASTGFTFRQNYKSINFKELVTNNGYYELLPSGTFKDSGTMVNTALVVLNK